VAEDVFVSAIETAQEKTGRGNLRRTRTYYDRSEIADRLAIATGVTNGICQWRSHCSKSACHVGI